MDRLCPECGDQSLIKKDGQTVCKECGFVVSYKEIDCKGGTRQKDDVPKYPVSVMGYNKKLGSYIDRRNIDSSGKEIIPKTQLTITRLRNYDSKFKSSEERKLQAAMVEFNQLLREISPEIRITNTFKKEFKFFFKKVLEKVSVIGRSYKLLGAATFCFLYKKKGNPNPIKQISKLTKIALGSIFRQYRNLTRIFEQKKQPQSFVNYISSVSATIGISMKTQKTALEIFAKIKKDFSGKSIKGVIAGLLYLLCKINGEEKTQEEIAKASSVAVVTLRSRLKDLIEKDL